MEPEAARNERKFKRMEPETANREDIFQEVGAGESPRNEQTLKGLEPEMRSHAMSHCIAHPGSVR